MDLLVGFVIRGVVLGLVYGVVALGINLIYKGSRTLNLAQPFFALFAAFIAFYLTGLKGTGGPETDITGIDTGPVFLRWIRYPLGLFLFEIGSKPRFALAAIITIGLMLRVSYRIEHDLMRRLENAPRLVNLVATIALAQGFLGIVLILFNRTEEQSTQTRNLPALIPDSVRLDVPGIPLSAGGVQVLIVVPLLAAGLAAFFRYTRFGVAIRAAAENREAAQLLGISARKVASFTWMGAGLLAAVGAFLIVPAQGFLDAQSVGIGLLIRALAASLVGGLTSLPGALVGGVLIGVTEGVISTYTNTVGISETVFFGIVIAILVFRPGGLFGQAQLEQEQAALTPSFRDLPARLLKHPVSKQVRWTAVAVAIMLLSAASLATGPFTNGILTRVMIFAIVGVSLTVLTGYAGQISLGHYAFVGVGAFTVGRLFGQGPVPFLVAVLLAVLVGMAVSLVIGLPALRIRGPYLAVVTLAFAIASAQWIFSSVAAGGSAGVDVAAPSLGPLDLGSLTNRPLFFFSLALFLLSAWVAHNFKQSRTGRGFFSLRENEKAAETFGVQLTRYRLLAFMLSGGIAALAGVLFALRAGTITGQDFDPIRSLEVVTMVIIGGLGSLVGAFLGAFLVFGAPSLLQGALGQAGWVPYAVTFGTGLALIIVITRARGGLAGLIFRVRDPVVEGMVWEAERPSADGHRARPPDEDATEALEVTQVTEDEPEAAARE